MPEQTTEWWEEFYDREVLPNIGHNEVVCIMISRMTGNRMDVIHIASVHQEDRLKILKQLVRRWEFELRDGN